MRPILLLIGLFLLSIHPTYTQTTLNFNSDLAQNQSDLDQKFTNYALTTVDLNEIYQSTTASQSITINFLGDHYHFSLYDNGLLSSDYFAIIQGPKGSQIQKDFSVKTYTGYLQDRSGLLTLTIDKDFFLAMLEIGDQRYFIEQPVNQKDKNFGQQLIFYNAKDAIKSPALHTCGVKDFEMKSDEIQNQIELRANTCKVVQLAIASDQSMYIKYGNNANNVMNHNIGVMNNVAVNYRHEFSDNIEFTIVTQFVSTTYANDPLIPNTTSTDYSVLLPAFRDWGNAVGGIWSAVTFDLAQFWSNRDFDGNVVGYAYTGVVCSNSRYHILMDYTNDPDLLRCMTSHEIGHNFSYGHDASGDPYIMAPSVSYTNIWSAASKTSISNHISTRVCLSDCTNPVSANFIFAPAALCNNGSVLFKDKSANSTNRTWTFTGGSPATSTVQQPNINYSSNGTFPAKIIANGISTMEITNAVLVTNAPSFNFGTCPAPSGTPGDLGPKQVIVSNLNYTSSDATTDGGKYQNRTCLGIGTILPSTTYTMTLNIGSSPDQFEGYEVYIDYNNNGTFETTELVGDSGGYGYYGPTQFDFTTPASLPSEQLMRMRVVTDYYANGITGPCYSPIRGQTEDYSLIYKTLNIILPVQLLGFNGKNKDQINEIYWRTADERNMKAYIVERSAEGKNFEPIGTVKSNQSSQSNIYKFQDNQWIGKNNYYRLKMFSEDGAFEWSETILINAEGKMSLENFSNTNQNNITFDLHIPNSTDIFIKLIDLTGNPILTDQLKLSNGRHELSYDINNIPAGIYFLQVKSNGGDEIIRKYIKY